jgi:acetyl-CoA C-acetyltransferase
MGNKVGIVALAQTKYSSCRNDVRQEELAHEVVKQVLQMSGLNYVEEGMGIYSSIGVCDDFWEGKTISDAPLNDIAGGHLRDCTRVAQDGSLAVLYGAATVLSGHDDIVLIVGGCKESQILSRNVLTNCGADPIYNRKLGLDYRGEAALQAQRYMYKYGITPEQVAKVVVKNLENAKDNPYAMVAKTIGINDVLQSRMLASPIHQLDEYPASDGAVAMILATEEKAKKITNNPIWINGFGCCRDSFGLGERELAECKSLANAAKKAYGMAGINNPQKEIDVFEISEHYSYQELLWSEGLGLCGNGEGGKLIDSGETQRKGKMPVNPSGGVLSGVPALIAGMSRVAEAFFQLKGEAGSRQVDGVKKALAHGTAGPAGQMQCVIVMSN